jgi:hypothetical protein
VNSVEEANQTSIQELKASVQVAQYVSGSNFPYEKASTPRLALFATLVKHQRRAFMSFSDACLS